MQEAFYLGYYQLWRSSGKSSSPHLFLERGEGVCLEVELNFMPVVVVRQVQELGGGRLMKQLCGAVAS